MTHYVIDRKSGYRKARGIAVQKAVSEREMGDR